MDEQRQALRIDIEIDVEYNMSQEQNWFNAGTRNISCSGICIITRSSFLYSPVLDLKFKLPVPDST